MKIIPRALSAGLALAAVPAQAFVTYQDIVSAATNPDAWSARHLVTHFWRRGHKSPGTARSKTILGNPVHGVFNEIIAIMGEVSGFLFIGNPPCLSAPADQGNGL